MLCSPIFTYTEGGKEKERELLTLVFVLFMFTVTSHVQESALTVSTRLTDSAKPHDWKSNKRVESN